MMKRILNPLMMKRILNTLNLHLRHRQISETRRPAPALLHPELFEQRRERVLLLLVIAAVVDDVAGARFEGLPDTKGVCRK